MNRDRAQSQSGIGCTSGSGLGLHELEPRLLLSASPLSTDGLVIPDTAEQPEVVAAVDVTQTLGIDVSTFQGQVNWASVAGSGREFAFIRALDRFGVQDTRFSSNIVNSQAAGVWAGAYQFVSPWTDGFNDAVAEATQFANLLVPYLNDNYLRPVIDIEAAPPLSPTPLQLDNTVLTDWIHDYMATFVSLTGVEPLIYSNTNYAVNAYDVGVNIYDLWLANWTGDPNNPPGGNADGVWNGYDLWQYSGGGESIPGIVGGVDGDVFFGDVNQLVSSYGISLPADDHGNDRLTATAVGVPSNTGGTLNSVLLDPDWFAVTLTGGEDYTFRVVGGTLGSAEVSLYTSTGTLISTSNVPTGGGVLAELQYTATIGDTFYIEVNSIGDTGGYLLAVQETDDHGDSIGTASVLGTLAFGGIQVSGDADYFSFAATAGMDYDIKVQDFGIADATLTLYTAGGAVVSQDSGSSPGGTHAQILWTASSTGTMYVAVTAQSGTVGDYFLTLAETNPLLAGDLDGDGFVGISDLNVVLGNWNQNVTPGDLLSGDPNGDGFVGIDDLNVVLGNWNAGTPPVAATGGSQSESTASSVAAAEPEVVATTAATTTKASASERASKRRDRRVATTPVRTDRAQGLAIANWRASERSAFGDRSGDQYSPAMGLWEQDDEG
jgi:GH25 family lysozyme M1 (1,4-beta-N-acetylmuramidase)